MISEHASPLATLGGVDAGGQNVYVAQVARELARRGHRVDVLTRRDDPALPDVVELESGVRVHHVRAGPARFVPKEQLLPHMAEFAKGAEETLLRCGRTDLLHGHFFMSGLVGLQLKRRLCLPLVMTFHALGLVRREHQREADGFPPQRVAIERRIVLGADRVIAECPQDRADLMRLYGARERGITMVPCGVDLDEFAPGERGEARRALGIPDDEFVVLQLGRLVPRKGVDNVVRAMARLPRSLPARLLVVGGASPEPDDATTPEIARLRGLARELGIEDRVAFLGHRQRDALARCYGAADVFVSTPWYEPFGITPLEAMACGRPVIGSDVGGIRYSVVDGVTGWLVPPRDDAALATRLLQLASQPEVANAFGRAGARRVRALFTWRRVAEQLEQVYRDVQRRPARFGALGPYSGTAAAEATL